MSLRLSKNNAPAYDYYSQGDGTDPVSVGVTLDNEGGAEDSNVVTAYLIATDYKYTGIVVQPIIEEVGIDWKVSLDNIVWADSVAIADMNALAADQATTVYLKAVVNNDGSVSSEDKISCDIEIVDTRNTE